MGVLEDVKAAMNMPIDTTPPRLVHNPHDIELGLMAGVMGRRDDGVVMSLGAEVECVGPLYHSRKRQEHYTRRATFNDAVFDPQNREGLIALTNAGRYLDSRLTFLVRGHWSLTKNTPMLVVGTGAACPRMSVVYFGRRRMLKWAVFFPWGVRGSESVPHWHTSIKGVARRIARYENKVIQKLRRHR